MRFLAPAAFGLAALAGPLIVLYMLRSRRRRTVVPSVVLWQELGPPVSSAVPWQRLRVTPLLILQILVLVLFAVAFARPFVTEETVLGPHTVFVIDTSGSMAMSSRLDDAIAEARRLSEDVSTERQISIVDAGPNPRVLAAFASEPETLDAAFAELAQTGGVERLDEGIRLARALATPDRPTNIAIFSDGGGSEPLTLEPIAGADHIVFDRFEDNVAIVAFSTEPSSEGDTRLFLEVANVGVNRWAGDVEISVGGLPAARVQFDLESDSRARQIVPVDAAAGDLVSARIADNADSLSLDDVAHLTVPAVSEATVAVFGESSIFLQALIEASPNLRLAAGAPPDILILDATDAPSAIDRPTWLIRPPTPPEGVTLTGVLRNTAASYQRPGEPILDSVDLSELVVAEADIVEAPQWLPIVRAGDVPLILLGEINGQRAVYFTFDITQSNLPVQVGFPILGIRTLEWLGSGSRAAVSDAEAAGVPIPLAAPSGYLAEVTTPDGRVFETNQALFSPATLAGVYGIRYLGPEGEVVESTAAVREFVAQESLGGAHEMETVEGVIGSTDSDRTALIREWVAWFLAALIVLSLLEWWVGHRNPTRAVEVPA